MTWYSNGTVTVTNGQRAITGAATDFVSNVLSGQAFVGPDGRTYEIEQIVSATQLLLRKPYMGGTAGAQDYAVLPTQSLMKDLADQAAGLIASFANVRDGVGQGLFPDGSVAAPAMRFAADQDTGFYRKTSNAVGFSSGGVDKVELGAVMASFAHPDLRSALDLIGRDGDGACLVRIINPQRTVVKGYWGLDATGSVLLVSEGASCKFVAAAGSGHYFSIGAATAAVLDGGALYPGTDNSLAVGGGGNRWSVVYSATGAIQTSDARLKVNVRELSAAEIAAAREIAQAIRIYQFTDAVAEKGEDGARLHVGVIAQHVGDVLTSHGLDPAHYGFWCHDSWDARAAVAGTPAQEDRPAVTDAEGHVLVPAQPATAAIPGVPARAAGDRYAIRYDELVMFIAAAQEQRLAALEAA
ncbi:tail fiber domain-containing protein [Sphingobium yanoikuyae]|mgnify:CR=1 FL=1|uniref:tail fiber domain-containing protein n=1 Tax=Sphingobium yanoikuyae TaxID=13690 RepID=UPI00242E00B8|nr:tail fiber domain-containing protein [Sphingobium yanoikuyae]